MHTDFVIQTRGLRKTYRGGPEVLRGLDLRVPRGSVYGFLGRNGSGKTTTIRMLMGLIRPDGGSVQVLGDSSFPMDLRIRQRVGYLSQDQRMFDWMSLERLTAFVSSFYPAWDRAFEEHLRAKLELPADAPLGALSRGQQQKAGLLLALAQRPELLILDEPAASLDTVVRREFLESILDLLTQEGITVFISSQILTDVERIADWVGLLAHGRMLLSAPLDDLKESFKRLRIRFEDKPPERIEVPGSIRTRVQGRECLATVRDFSPARLQEIRERFGAGVEVQDVDLEEIFIELLG